MQQDLVEWAGCRRLLCAPGNAYTGYVSVVTPSQLA